VRIDLHAHSTASDGTDSPAELMAAAAAAGLQVLGLTDHDSTAGWAQAATARPAPLTLVPGAEFSCVHEEPDGRRISLHVLGYLFDPDHPAVGEEQQRLREHRRERARRMVQRMQQDGIPIEWQRVEALAEHGSVGRPHLGRALVGAGVVSDVPAAFRTLLSSRSPYYIRKADTDVLAAVRLIRAAGGVPVFAHPLARRRGPVVSDEVVAAMATAGLVGIEVDHPDHDEDDRAHAAGLAADLGLVPTGSSDYHGTNKTTRLGQCTTTAEAYERLLSRPTARRPID
jgi:predicted metal-dependent phosphoesterase TrpH